MEGAEGASRNLNLSASTSQIKTAIERKREFDRRVLALKSEYERLNPNKRPGIVREDMKEFFRSNAINEDEGTCTQIFEELDENRDGKVTKNEYIRRCLEIEDIVVDKINSKVTEINKLSSQYEETINKLAEAKNTERTNRFGLMEGSILKVSVVEARGLVSKGYEGKLNPYVLLAVGSKHISTKFVNSTLNPLWNEEIYFDIVTGEEDVKISIMNTNVIASDEFRGGCEVQLDTLTDQLRHDVWLDLADIEDNPVPGRLHLMLQWIHSYVTYYADVLALLSDSIRLKEKDRSLLEDDLSKLREPHGIIKYIQIVRAHRVTYEKMEYPITPMINSSVAISHREASLIYPPEEMVSSDNAMWVAVVICAIVISPYRPDLFNVCLGALGFAASMFNVRISGDMRALVLALGFATAFDCVWMVFRGYAVLFSLYLPRILALVFYIAGAVLKGLMFISYRKQVSSVPLLTPRQPPEAVQSCYSST